jgi:PAS domain S-box-containing protein
MTVKARPRGVPYFEESVRELSATIAAANLRTAKLRGPTTDLAQEPGVLREALEELRVHQEELAVANEELRAQLDELGSATARIHHERDRYRKLFDLTPDSYFVTDHVGMIRDLNAAASQMLEVEARFLQGKPLAVLVDAADARMLREAVNTLRAKHSVELELRFKRRKSDPEWHTLKAVVLEEENAILWFARSVQAEVETRVALAGATYDARVVAKSAHTADLARATRDMEEMLVRERRLRSQLEQEHVAKDRFLAVLSQDLRAPLNAVVGWTQLLRRERLDQGARDRALATIERNAHAQLRLVEELLDISRIGADKVQLERVPVVLNELVAHAVGAVAVTAREGGVDVTTSVGPDLLIVAGDRRRLNQAISNLLSNALKFMPPSGGRVFVALQRDGRDARIVVTDTGRGIAQGLLPQLFDPFRQSADDATANGNVGLGLYMVRQCVQMHGGRVLAESDGPGRGARFTLVLPLTDAYDQNHAESEPSEAIEVSASSRAPGTGALEAIRVLVVDDEEDARELMAAILRHHGAVVTLAGDVQAALHSFDASPPDVVLSDIALPGRSGLDLARDLRSRPKLHAALVAVSGYSSPDQIDGALTAGFDVHMAKPVDPAELIEVVRDAARLRTR